MDEVVKYPVGVVDDFLEDRPVPLGRLGVDLDGSGERPRPLVELTVRFLELPGRVLGVLQVEVAVEGRAPRSLQPWAGYLPASDG